MKPPQHCIVTLTDKREYSAKFIHYFFEFVDPPKVDFVAGQYASFQVTQRGDRRAYSICNNPVTSHGFEVLADISPQGLGSTFFASLEFGQHVKILAPLGIFTISTDPAEESLVFIATGAGITPFRSMILDQLQNKHDQRPIILYWGLRHNEDLFWQDEFQELCQSFSNFTFHPTLSQPSDQWPLCRGRVTDCLTVHTWPTNAGFYLCGSTAMINDTTTLLRSKGISPEHIHHEKFY